MKLVVLLMISLLVTGCGKEKIIEDTSKDVLSTNMSNVEVYSDVYLQDIINLENKDAKIVSDNYQIDTTKLGKQELEVYYELDDKKYVYKFDLAVTDTTPPLVFSGTNKTVNVGYEKDLCNLITYGDNYTGDVKCKITGDYDVTKKGTYKLVYTLSDSSNNIKEVNVTLKVVEPTSGGGTTTNTTPKKTEFSDIYSKHKSDKTEIGIDVSKWQSNVDYNKVKAAGATFVMMRIGVEGSKTGELSIDEYYKDNIKKAKEAGLKVGVYLYSIATSVKEAKEHAKWVVDTLDGEKLDLPIVFDWENWSNWNSYKISFHEINEIANTFMSEVEKSGYTGMLYSSKFYLETIWTNKNNHPVWLAHYTSKTNYEGDYMIWQLCNDGHIDGINGDVDIDVMYK